MAVNPKKGKRMEAKTFKLFSSKSTWRGLKIFSKSGGSEYTSNLHEGYFWISFMAVLILKQRLGCHCWKLQTSMHDRHFLLIQLGSVYFLEFYVLTEFTVPVVYSLSFTETLSLLFFVATH